jgi:hypothetical protein
MIAPMLKAIRTCPDNRTSGASISIQRIRFDGVDLRRKFRASIAGSNNSTELKNVLIQTDKEKQHAKR